jgi:transcriptional regulator with XRE-family HTH domain
MDVNERLARRISDLRFERGISIVDLSVRSGVSRAMISRIERAESSATATVLSKLAIGFGVLLPELFTPSTFAEPRLQQRDPLVTRKGQPEWQDPDSGYKRRTLTPATATQPLQLSEINFPPGARVTFENAFGAALVQQQIWMLEGDMDLRLGKETTHLKAGDCMAMTLDRPITFHNPGSKAARYLVALLKAPAAKGKHANR